MTNLEMKKEINTAVMMYCSNALLIKASENMRSKQMKEMAGHAQRYNSKIVQGFFTTPDSNVYVQQCLRILDGFISKIADPEFESFHEVIAYIDELMKGNVIVVEPEVHHELTMQLGE